MSRVDFCVDLPNVVVEDFARAALSENLVCLAKSSALYFQGAMRFSNVTGLTFGKGDIVLRIYDKKLETEHSPEKRAYLEHYRWGGHVKSAVRVEFQIRRNKLKDWNMGTLEGYLKERAARVAYLTTNWARVVVDKHGGRSNVSRAGISNIWVKVQEAFEAWMGKAEPAKPEKAKLKPLHEPSLVRQAVGCFKSLLAQRNPEVPPTIEKFISDVSGMIKECLFDPFAFEQSFIRKVFEKSSLKNCRDMEVTMVKRFCELEEMQVIW